MAVRTASEAKMYLKILIDTKTNKVVFAEAGKDFVDFIFHMMSLPLSTVVKLLNEKGMVGCLGDLYKSIDNLNSQYFEPNRNKDSVLMPKFTLSVPLLSIKSSDVQYNYSSTTTNGSNNENFQGFVKEAVAYLVMDNLEVKPLSISLVKFHAKDFDSLEERHVQFGIKEGLAMLKASLETKNVLSAVFLEKRERTISIPGIGWLSLLAFLFGAIHLVFEIRASSEKWLAT